MKRFCLIALLSLTSSGCAGFGSFPTMGLPTSDKPESLRAPAPVAGEKSSERTSVRGDSLAGQLSEGLSHQSSGDLGKARAIYERLVKQHPGQASPHHRLGIVSDLERRHLDAQASFITALELEPRNAEILNDLGYCFYLQGKLAKAESALGKAVALDPSNDRFHNNLGMVLGQMKRYDEAHAQFRQAGSEADAYYNLAFIYASQDQIAKATHCFHQALASDPTHEKSHKALRNFEQYEQDPNATLEESSDGYYVPYLEAGDQPAHPIQNLPTPRQASATTRALLNKAREGNAATGE